MSNAADFFEQLDLFDWYKDVVDTSIHDLINQKLAVQGGIENYKYVDYYPVYTRCKLTESKVLKYVKIRNSNKYKDFITISIDEIDASGASWDELIDFLDLSLANCVNYSEIMYN